MTLLCRKLYLLDLFLTLMPVENEGFFGILVESPKSNGGWNHGRGRFSKMHQTDLLGVSLRQAASHVFMSRLHWVPKCISSLSKVADWDNKDTPTYYLYVYIYIFISIYLYIESYTVYIYIFIHIHHTCKHKIYSIYIYNLRWQNHIRIEWQHIWNYIYMYPFFCGFHGTNI